MLLNKINSFILLVAMIFIILLLTTQSDQLLLKQSSPIYSSNNCKNNEYSELVEIIKTHNRILGPFLKIEEKINTFLIDKDVIKCKRIIKHFFKINYKIFNRIIKSFE
jgi:hypothetical protein